MSCRSMRVIKEARTLIFSVSGTKEEGQCIPTDITFNPKGQNNSNPLIVVQHEDGTWQGADASGVVVIEKVPTTLACLLIGKYECSVSALRQICDSAWDNGCRCQYTVSKEFVDRCYSRAGWMIGPYTGLVRSEGDEYDLWRGTDGRFYAESAAGDVEVITEQKLWDTFLTIDGCHINPRKILVPNQLLVTG